MTVRTAAHPAGTVLRCPACGATHVCVGDGVITLVCDGNGTHRVEVMRPVIDATSHERAS